MQNAIVTGANRGIGLALCKELSERGYSVTALCRKSNNALDALSVNVVDGYDVADSAAASTFYRLSAEIRSNHADLCRWGQPDQ